MIMKYRFLEITSFVSGMIIMTLEILGFRLFAPYFGYSIYVSGGLIGMIMVALAIGYYYGGIIADKKPETQILYKIILASSAYIFLIGFFYKDILTFFSGLGVIYEPLIATFFIFGLPMILLSIVSPFIVKLVSKNYKIGMAAGRISSISTIGSIFGTFLTTFFLIPKVGSHISLYLCGVVLLLTSIIGLFQKNKKYLVFFLLALLFNSSATRPEKNVIFQKDSAYNLVKVTEKEGKLFLILDNSRWIQSVYPKDGSINKQYYYYYMNMGLLISGGKEVLILGMGAGASARQMLALFDAKVDGVEIDPDVVDVSYKYFGLKKDDPRLNIYNEDARQFLRKTKKTYDVVEVDTFNCAYIPFHLSTKEFFESIGNDLSDQGVLIMNVYSPEKDSENELTDSIGYTISQTFPSVYILDLGTNNILFATKSPTTLEFVRSKLKKNTIKELDDLVSYSSLIKEFKASAKPTLLTDDKSSIDMMSRGRY